MRVGSVCSGVGCIDLGLERSGFETVWQIEILAKRRSILERHWPAVRRYNDLREVATNAADLAPVDLIAGGTPCQDLSVAGRGEGLGGERSGLFYDFLRLADRFPAAWILWENVPGALSSPEGNPGADFCLVVEGFTGFRPSVPSRGWRGSGFAAGPLRWCAWRVLDAQYFGVAQRRRRVFVVAGPRGRPAPEVLFEPESLPGNPPPSRSAGSVSAAVAIKGAAIGRRPENGPQRGGYLTDGSAFCLDGTERQAVAALVAGRGRGDHDGQYSQLITQGLTASSGGRGGSGLDPQSGLLVVDTSQITHPENRASPKPGDPAPTMNESAGLIAYQCQGSNIGPAGTLRAGSGSTAGGVPASSAKTTDTAGKHGSGPKNVVAGPAGVRRLLPTEYERLQGLPDGWTGLDAEGREVADTPRYQAVGDGAAVPVIEWIGRRLLAAMEDP